MRRWENSVIIVFVILAISICILLKFPAQAAKQEKGKYISVLVDTSKSMENDDWREEAFEWVKEICALCVDTEIGVTVITFNSNIDRNDGIVSVFERDVMDESSLAEIDKTLENIESDGLRTDQLSALSMAQENMDAKEADKKTIVMLTDGTLDYDNVYVDGKPQFSDQEKEDIEKFRQLCTNMAGKGYQIFLVDFSEGANMLKNIEGTVYFGKDKSPVDIIRQMYEKNDYLLTTGECSLQDGELLFSLDKKYYRTIVNVYKTESYSFNSDDIYISKRKSENVVKPYRIINLSRSSYLYFQDLPEGSYLIKTDVKLQDTFRIWNMDKRGIVELQITVKDADGESELTGTGNIYNVMKDMDEFWLEIQVKYMEDDAVEELTCQVENGEKINVDYPAETGLKIVIPFEMKKNEYACTIRARTQSGAEEESIVRFKYSDIAIAQENQNIHIGKEYPLLKSQRIPKDYNNNLFTYLVCGEEYNPGTITDKFSINAEGYIVFKEDGLYNVKVLFEGSVRRDINFTVADRENWWEKKEIVISIIFLAIVFVFAGYLTFKKVSKH